jgi:nuclease S1
VCRLSIMLVAFFAFCGNAWAWGDTGHKIVCEIAFQLAAADTRAAIRKLIRTDQEFDTFADSCIFPDHPRKRASEHFVNLPRNSKGLKSDECPAADKCVVTAILNDTEILTSRAERRRDKLIALKFLGHWVGDIHQPLHVSFEDDRGGNNITVSGECSGKMHGMWDSCLVTKAVGDDVSEAAAELAEAITPAMMEQWNASEPFQWANESFAIAEATNTKYCIMHAPSCDPPPSGHVTIDAAYVEHAKAIIREQLQKAGARLAHLLDRAFGN